MPCKHADLALIYAKQMAECDDPWELWEYKHLSGTEWIRPHNHIVLHDDQRYRQIPKTIKINGYDVPEPMRVKPEHNGKYYYVDLDIYGGGVNHDYYESHDLDLIRLGRGICHETEQAALIHAKALFSFSELKE